MSVPGYTTVIGLEVHVQLNTVTKLFCRCAYRFGAPPNTLVCPVCLGLPGALPVLNRQALELGIRTGLACAGQIAKITRFDRKNYFYPDLPKGYQISQLDHPITAGGRIELAMGGQVDLERIHLEEDAGKSIHTAAGYSLVDLNRCSVPLLEVVSKPDIRSPAQAHDFLVSLKQLLRYIQVSDCDMEKGSLRCDANISLKPQASETLGTKVEIKNLNSFKMVQKALEFEETRQGAALDKGERIIQETRLWDEQALVSRPMRSKEEAHDYRYFPEPDLPPVNVTKELVERIRGELPELPAAKRARFRSELGLNETDTEVLIASREIADFFEATAQACGEPKLAANWVRGELLRFLKESEHTLTAIPLTPTTLGGLIHLVKQGKLTNQAAKKIFDRLATEGGDPESWLDKMGLATIDDETQLEPIVRQVLAENPTQVEYYLAGKEVVIKALMGKVMRDTKGRANPQRALAMLQKLLAEIGEGSG